MKIADVRTYVVDCFRTNWVFVQVLTDEGIEGIGEGTLEYKEHALVGAVNDLKRALIGENPEDIERLWHTLYRDAYWRGGPVLMSALSAVEMALWDISAKALGVPVYRLLGGRCRDRVKIYVNGWFAGAREPAQFAEKALEVKARGIGALKWDPFGKAYLTLSPCELQSALDCVAAVREAAGDDMELLIEGHGRFDVPTAVTIARELAPLRPRFFEEPVPPGDLRALKDVKERSPVPISAGERLYTRWDYRELFELRACDCVQPDVSHAGGIAECRKIAAMAECRHIPFMPHNPSGPVACAATLQLAAATPNFLMLEIMLTDVPWRRDITDESLRFEDGCILIPDRPGLGITLRPGAAGAHPYAPHDLRHYKGTLTDIRPPEAIPYF